MNRFLQRRAGPSFPVPLDDDYIQLLVSLLNGNLGIDPAEALDEKTSEALGQLINDLLTFERMAADENNYSRGFGGGFRAASGNLHLGRLVGEPRTLLNKLNNQLATIKWTPEILSTLGKTMYILNTAGGGDWNSLAGQIFVLASYGKLDNLRRCAHCNKWLFAPRGHKRFCSTGCRVSHFKKTPEGRARNREYMRMYRAQPSNREAGRRDKAIPRKER
jgi:hypothetical protein